MKTPEQFAEALGAAARLGRKSVLLLITDKSATQRFVALALPEGASDAAGAGAFEGLEKDLKKLD